MKKLTLSLIGCLLYSTTNIYGQTYDIYNHDVNEQTAKSDLVTHVADSVAHMVNDSTNCGLVTDNGINGFYDSSTQSAFIPATEREELLKEAKKYKAGGIAMASFGSAMTTFFLFEFISLYIGTRGTDAGFIDIGFNSPAEYVGGMAVGAAIALGSISMFKKSKKLRKEAETITNTSLSVGSSVIYSPTNGTGKMQPTPALSFTINF